MVMSTSDPKERQKLIGKINEFTSLKAKKESPWMEFTSTLFIIGQSHFELFSVYIINILLSLDYYILTTMIPLYFTQEQDTSDTAAGVIFGLVGIVIGIFAIILGPIINSFGCRKSLICASAFTLIGFIMVLSTRNLIVNLIANIFFLSVGCAMSWSSVELGAKLFTEEKARNTSNSLLMMGNFFSGIIAGVSIDWIWITDTDLDHAYFLIYFTAAVAAGLSLLVSFTIKDPTENIEEEETEEVEFSFELFKSKKFVRFSALILLITVLRSGCFGHLDATFPKYLVRQSGGKAHFGAYLALHSITMLLGALGFTPLAFVLSSYALIVIGGFLGAIAPLILVFGMNSLSCIIFVIIISCGECIWIPRLLDYTVKIAPKGTEGIYLALCNCPFYFAMILTGVFSGSLLEAYCPEDDNSNCYKMWFVIGLSTICIPIILVMFRPWLEEPEVKAEPEYVIIREPELKCDKVSMG